MAEVAKFTQADTSPSYFIDFLTYLDSQPDVRKMRAGVAAQMNLAPGDKVLDLGCGIGGPAFALAEFTGPTGLVAGVDISASLLEVAKSRTAGRPGFESQPGTRLARLGEKSRSQGSQIRNFRGDDPL